MRDVGIFMIFRYSFAEDSMVLLLRRKSTLKLTYNEKRCELMRYVYKLMVYYRRLYMYQYAAIENSTLKVVSEGAPEYVLQTSVFIPC